MLLHIPGILDPAQAARMRQRLEAARWIDGRETVGAQGAQVKRNLQLPDASPLRAELADEVLAALAASPLYHAAVLPAKTLPPRFNRYDGGELVVSDTYGEHEVKLPAGDLIVYPSDSLHRVEPVTRGARFAAFFWVQSLLRDAQRRRLLLELDGGIQQLAASGADRDALLRLTGVYHNLLRQWSET